MTEKSGNLNLDIPDMMYMSGTVGLIEAFLYENGIDNLNNLVGLLISFVCVFVYAALGGLVYSVLTITLRANQSVTGLTPTTLGAGLGNFFGDSLAELAGGVGRISVAVTGAVCKTPIPGLSRSGVIRQIFFSRGFLTYLAVALTLASAFFLIKTRRGPNLRTMSESPATTDATGISVMAYKYLTTCLGGGISGLGRSYFIMEYPGGTQINNRFGDRGRLAITLTIFALWKPVSVVWGSILFGGLYILYLYISGLGRGAQEIFRALPYVATIVTPVITSLRKEREY